MYSDGSTPKYLNPKYTKSQNTQGQNTQSPKYSKKLKQQYQLIN